MNKNQSILGAVLWVAIAIPSQGLADGESTRPFYVGMSWGRVLMDDARMTVDNDTQVVWTVGWQLTDAWAIELEYNAADALLDPTVVHQAVAGATGANWSMVSGSVNARWMAPVGGVRPYVLVGMGYMNHDSILGSGSNASYSLGAGAEGDLSDRWGWRFQFVYRVDNDDDSLPGESSFGDYLINGGLMIRFGGQ